MKEHVVPDGVQEMKLARYLARAYPMMPGHALRQALGRRDVRVNGQKADDGATVAGGDAVRIYVPDECLSGPVRVIHAGEGLIAVDKPAGLPVDVDADGIGEDTLIARVRREHPSARLCHRLDAGTGGVMLMALDDRREGELLAAFRAHEIGKVYLCEVRGAPLPGEATLTHYLKKESRDARVQVFDAPRHGCVTAKLRYRVIGSGGETARVRVELMTGRTHQIRAQMAHIGHPLVGDDKYGDRALNKRLHAKEPMLWCVALSYAGQTFESRPDWAKEEKYVD